jgi:hypothetical protein
MIRRMRRRTKPAQVATMTTIQVKRSSNASLDHDPVVIRAVVVVTRGVEQGKMTLHAVRDKLSVSLSFYAVFLQELR